MKKDKLLILDCDGVLVRSETANRAYYNHLFARYGLPEVKLEDTKERHLLHTLSTPQVIDHFFPGDLKNEVTDYANTLEYLDFAEFIEPEPGWRETLIKLKVDTRICVATNRGRSAPLVIEKIGLGDCIEEILTVHHVKNPKPAPDLLLLALETFAMKKEAAFYVGDSELDRKASRAAGIKFIGFRIDGDFRIEHPSELEKMC